MGYTAPANAAYFQGQGGVYQAAAAAQVYTPQPSAMYFQQPYGSQAVNYPPAQAQGNSYAQVGNYDSHQIGTPGQPHFSPYGEFKPQGNAYVQA